jgi:hypothetical protein
MSSPQLPPLNRSITTARVTSNATKKQEIRTLEALAEHSAVIEELRNALGFQDPKTAMSWVFEQLEQSPDLRSAIFKLLED